MRARSVLSVCLGAVSLCAPWLAGCDGQVVSAPPPDTQQPPPSTPGWPTSPPTQPSAAQPPPISGGTLLVLKDGHTAVAADSDQDRVWIVDLTSQSVVGNVLLQPGDEPGRVVEDAAGRVHVALRRGGALASIDPGSGTVTRRAVCPAPRGLAYDADLDAIHVACADGLLATLPAAGGPPLRTVRLDGDLRDVVVQDGKLYVSRFRAAELLAVASDGTIAQRITLPSATSVAMTPTGMVTAVPSVAYRTVALPGGALAMLHQRAQAEAVSTDPGGYSGFGMCPGVGIVHDAVTLISPGTAPAIADPLPMLTLAVDLAVSPDGSQVALAVPSGQGITVATYPMAALQAPSGGPAPCAPPPAGPGTGPGQVVAVAFDGQGQVVAQTRDPATISVAGISIPMPSAGPSSDGHNTFYTSTKGSIACASCHPEGGDDGRVWQFDNLGPRRTQNIRGGVLARAPFHWSGDIPDMDTLVSVVFEGRMVGPSLSEPQIAALGQWMDAQPALVPPAPADPLAVGRGKDLFADPSVGCASCHGGPQLSNHQLVDVGTGGTFKVPSLLAIRYRAPYLHDGCAVTLLDRFGASCGGGDQHGQTSQLDAGQLADLVAYLESL